MKFLRLLILLWIAAMTNGYSQESSFIVGKNDTIRVATTLMEGERVPWIVLNTVEIVDTRLFKTPEDRARYLKLKRDVLKALPYARYAAQRYRDLERQLALTGNRREQRRIVKDFEREIKEKINNEVKNMTITQGVILTKLIDREIKSTTYELLKEMKGGFNAFMFQSLARVFGHNLKNRYDPQEERDIESIILSQGYYRYN